MSLPVIAATGSFDSGTGSGVGDCNAERQPTVKDNLAIEQVDGVRLGQSQLEENAFCLKLELWFGSGPYHGGLGHGVSFP